MQVTLMSVFLLHSRCGWATVTIKKYFVFLLIQFPLNAFSLPEALPYTRCSAKLREGKNREGCLQRANDGGRKCRRPDTVVMGSELVTSQHKGRGMQITSKHRGLRGILSEVSPRWGLRDKGASKDRVRDGSERGKTSEIRAYTEGKQQLCVSVGTVSSL